jgi:hypothetical protein
VPEFGTAFAGSFRRIVQTPGGIAIFYDVDQGQGWQRNIVMDSRPHLAANIWQWYGVSRGYWEGATLVIDVTNHGPKTDFFGSRENLHYDAAYCVVTLCGASALTMCTGVGAPHTRESCHSSGRHGEPHRSHNDRRGGDGACLDRSVE